MNPDPNIPDEIRQRFPHLRPVKSAPTLMTMNGIGVTLYGKRDFDQETQTYVKTRCFCFLFVPLFALDAFRVADAGGRRWYFLGKESISSFARSWNIAAACILVFAGLAIGWQSRTSSPAYRARQEIKRADALMSSGDALKATAIYRQQIDGPAAAEAREGLKTSIEACLQSDQPQTVVTALRTLAGLPASVNQPAPLVPDASNRGLALAGKFRAQNPDGALDVLNATAALDPRNQAIPPMRIELLKQVIAASPDNTNRVVELALIYENSDKLQESWALLQPYAHRLGDTEGARILGQKMLQDGNNADAYGLLFPYVQSRLQRLHAIEASYTNAFAQASERALKDLNAGRADQAFYIRYKTASKLEKADMVDNYIEAQMKTDAALLRAEASLKEANQIVQVALDLGMVQLNRAQQLKNATERKAELEAAEKTFLAIRGIAGHTDTYRLYLGQVYYWLGRSAEGKALFDQLLADRKRDYRILISLGSTLRAVGETAAARALAEEAYTSAKSNQQKFDAASLRALLCKDEDDRIAWLEKSDPEATWVQIELNSSRGRRALQQGDKAAAATLLRKAIAGYDKQAKSPAMLNNCGLACFDLYQASGNIDDHKRGMDLLEEAIAMDPTDSILLHNTTYFLMTRALMDVIRDSVHTEVLGEQASLHMLSSLYQDDAERSRIFQQLHDSDAMKKALTYLDKNLLLAPKDIGLYVSALSIYGSFRDLAELQKLQQRLQIASPDLTELRQDALTSYKGTRDKEFLEQFEKRIQVLQTLAQSPAVSGHALTLERVNVSLIEAEQQAWVYGRALDSQQLLQRALTTYNQHQSSASRAALQSAYLFRANEELARQSPEYSAMVERTRRAMSPEYLLAFVLERGGPLGDTAARNENLKKALALEKELIERFPSWTSVTEWALLHSTDPGSAASIVQHLKENATGRLMNDLQYQINPVSASAVLEQYWTHKLMDDPKGANEVYQAAVGAGVPLPPL